MIGQWNELNHLITDPKTVSKTCSMDDSSWSVYEQQQTNTINIHEPHKSAHTNYTIY